MRTIACAHHHHFSLLKCARAYIANDFELFVCSLLASKRNTTIRFHIRFVRRSSSQVIERLLQKKNVCLKTHAFIIDSGGYDQDLLFVEKKKKKKKKPGICVWLHSAYNKQKLKWSTDLP